MKRIRIILICLVGHINSEGFAQQLDQINFKVLFHNSIFSYELTMFNDSLFDFNENNPTGNTKMIKIKCNFYLVDTSNLLKNLNDCSAYKVKTKCIYYLSDISPSNALINEIVYKNISYSYTTLFYDSANTIGYFYIDILIDDKLRKYLKKGKILKYITTVFEYSSQLKHTCIFEIPYEDGF